MLFNIFIDRILFHSFVKQIFVAVIFQINLSFKIRQKISVFSFNTSILLNEEIKN